jgi:hypothetical protein
MKASILSLHAGAAALCASALLGCAVAAWAGPGSEDLLCAPSDVAQCDASARCERVSASEVDLPPFVRIRLGKKQLVSVTTPERVSAIENVREHEGLTILQGAENGRAWSLVIDRASGRLTGSIADGEGSFVLAGACMVP